VYADDSILICSKRKALIEARSAIVYTSRARTTSRCQYSRYKSASSLPKGYRVPKHHNHVKKMCAMATRSKSNAAKPTRNPKKSRSLEGSPQRAFQPSQRFNLALPLPLGPCLDPAAAGPVPERLELLPNSYCLLLPGRPPFALVLANVSLHVSLQNHFVRPVGALSRFTQARWNHSRGHSSLSHAIMLPYDTSLQ
jgi:hypothetical protein